MNKLTFEEIKPLFEEIKPLLDSNLNKPFPEIFTEEELDDVVKNKGKSGILLEKAIGLLPDSSFLPDLKDMEIKTNSGRESIAISLISSHIDEIMNGISFKDSWIYTKINRFLYIYVDKSKDYKQWEYKHYRIIDINEITNLYERLESEFNYIIKQIIQLVNSGKQLTTINGDNSSAAYFQIRTKDSRGGNGFYHPIKYKGNRISDKNYAFYFRNLFVRQVIETNFFEGIFGGSS
jgi:DNA mismatch repair protein MutH